MLPPRSSGPWRKAHFRCSRDGTVPGTSWNPWTLASWSAHTRLAGPQRPGTWRRRGTRPTYVGRVPRGHRSQGLADPADRWTDFQLGNRNCWPALLQMQDRAVRLEENVKMFGNSQGVSGDPSPTASKASVFWRRYLNSVSAHV